MGTLAVACPRRGPSSSPVVEEHTAASRVPFYSRMPRGPPHADVIRPGRWPKLITGKTTEGMPVVLISIKYVSKAHLAVKRNLTSTQGFRSKAGHDKMFDVFEISFFGHFQSSHIKINVIFGILMQNWTV